MFSLSPQERILFWKKFRDSIENLCIEEKLIKIYQLWRQAPIVSKTIDPENLETWITDWDLIIQNKFCPFSIVLGMESTCRLLNLQTEIYYQNHETYGAEFILKCEDLFISYRGIIQKDDIQILNKYIFQNNKFFKI